MGRCFLVATGLPSALIITRKTGEGLPGGIPCCPQPGKGLPGSAGVPGCTRATSTFMASEAQSLIPAIGGRWPCEDLTGLGAGQRAGDEDPLETHPLGRHVASRVIPGAPSPELLRRPTLGGGGDSTPVLPSCPWPHVCSLARSVAAWSPGGPACVSMCFPLPWGPQSRLMGSSGPHMPHDPGNIGPWPPRLPAYSCQVSPLCRPGFCLLLR